MKTIYVEQHKFPHLRCTYSFVPTRKFYIFWGFGCWVFFERENWKTYLLLYVSKKKNSMTVSRISTPSSTTKDKKKDCATKKPEIPFPLPVLPQRWPFSFMQNYRNFTSVVRMSLCCGLSPGSVRQSAAPQSHPAVCSPVGALADLGPSTGTYRLFFIWAGKVSSPLSLLQQTELALTLVAWSPSPAQLNKSLQCCFEMLSLFLVAIRRWCQAWNSTKVFSIVINQSYM